MDILRKKADNVGMVSMLDFGKVSWPSEASMQPQRRMSQDPDPHNIRDRDSPDPERRSVRGYRYLFNLMGDVEP